MDRRLLDQRAREGGSPMKIPAIAALATTLAAGAAWAGELDSPSSNEPALWVQDVSKAAGCSARGGMCFKPGAASTVLAEVPAAAKGVIARFSRAALVAADGKAPHSTSLAWSIEMAAQLKRPAVSGNTLFVFFDLGDPNSVKNHENTALFQ